MDLEDAPKPRSNKISEQYDDKTVKANQDLSQEIEYFGQDCGVSEIENQAFVKKRGVDAKSGR